MCVGSWLDRAGSIDKESCDKLLYLFIPSLSLCSGATAAGWCAAADSSRRRVRGRGRRHRGEAGGGPRHPGHRSQDPGARALPSGPQHMN